MSETETTPASAHSTDIVARRSWSFLWKPVVGGVVVFLFGIWSIYDGFIKWPAENQKRAEITEQMAELDRQGKKGDEQYAALATEQGKYQIRSATSINLNKLLGILLPPLGLWWLFNNLHGSRGEVRLSGETLHIPGHPPISLDQITELDSKRWERKGIAEVTYQDVSGKTGNFRLDDFIYERKPIDLIYDKIAAKFPSLDDEPTDNGEKEEDRPPVAPIDPESRRVD